jgi:uncharacterized protein (TIGR00106 family)
MSVLIEFAIFPTDKGESKSQYVARVIEMIKESGLKYQLTPMGTILECEDVAEGLEVINKAYETLKVDCNRIYSIIKIDYRKNQTDRMKRKIESVQKKLDSK